MNKSSLCVGSCHQIPPLHRKHLSSLLCAKKHLSINFSWEEFQTIYFIYNCIFRNIGVMSTYLIKWKKWKKRNQNCAFRSTVEMLIYTSSDSRIDFKWGNPILKKCLVCCNLISCYVFLRRSIIFFLEKQNN